MRASLQRFKIAGQIGYHLHHWDGLANFVDDGRVELDTNVVERAIRFIVITRTFCPAES
ncbi:IS66 family transposase [Bradyrhizobium valentinum]|uniref:IS66 family transposase n=1 Tax=Bradyrhizobium valentinum TaxID=1518501 RepID=UPI000AC36E4B